MIGACYTDFEGAPAFSVALSELIRRLLLFMVSSILQSHPVDQPLILNVSSRLKTIPALSEQSITFLRISLIPFMDSLVAVKDYTN